MSLSLLTPNINVAHIYYQEPPILYVLCIKKSCWIVFAGEFQIGDNIQPLDPNSVASIVQFGEFEKEITEEAEGYSLIYSQLYPFEGLQNYTSGIIHHVRLTGNFTNCFLS